jgi:hypothetical protein
MGESYFNNHEIQILFLNLSKKNKIIKEFIVTDFGKKIIDYSISNYSEYQKFENIIIPQIGIELEKFKEKFNFHLKLIKDLKLNKTKHNLSKI